MDKNDHAVAVFITREAAARVADKIEDASVRNRYERGEMKGYYINQFGAPMSYHDLRDIL